MTLFQLNSAIVPDIWNFIQPTDAILLKGDACYLLLQQRQWPTALLYVLATDMQARSLDLGSNKAIALSDEQWVALTLTYQRVLNCL